MSLSLIIFMLLEHERARIHANPLFFGDLGGFMCVDIDININIIYDINID
jgi:hypothetical protein